MVQAHDQNAPGKIDMACWLYQWESGPGLTKSHQSLLKTVCTLNTRGLQPMQMFLRGKTRA